MEYLKESYSCLREETSDLFVDWLNTPNKINKYINQHVRSNHKMLGGCDSRPVNRCHRTFIPVRDHCVQWQSWLCLVCRGFLVLIQIIYSITRLCPGLIIIGHPDFHSYARSCAMLSMGFNIFISLNWLQHPEHTHCWHSLAAPPSRVPGCLFRASIVASILFLCGPCSPCQLVHINKKLINFRQCLMKITLEIQRKYIIIIS